MAVEVTEMIKVEVLRPETESQVAPAASASAYSGLAVVQADRWIAVSPELGTVAEGSSAEEALDRLEAAINDVIEIAKEEHLPHGEPLQPNEIAELIVEHRRHTNAPVTMRSLRVTA